MIYKIKASFSAVFSQFNIYTFYNFNVNVKINLLSTEFIAIIKSYNNSMS